MGDVLRQQSTSASLQWFFWAVMNGSYVSLSLNPQTNNSLYPQNQLSCACRCVCPAPSALPFEHWVHQELSQVVTINSLAHWTMACSVWPIFIHRSRGSQRGPAWVVCSAEIGKTSLSLKGYKFESRKAVKAGTKFVLEMLSAFF